MLYLVGLRLIGSVMYVCGNEMLLWKLFLKIKHSHFKVTKLKTSSNIEIFINSMSTTSPEKKEKSISRLTDGKFSNRSTLSFWHQLFTNIMTRHKNIIVFRTENALFSLKLSTLFFIIILWNVNICGTWCG